MARLGYANRKDGDFRAVLPGIHKADSTRKVEMSDIERIVERVRFRASQHLIPDDSATRAAKENAATILKILEMARNRVGNGKSLSWHSILMLLTDGLRDYWAKVVDERAYIGSMDNMVTVEMLMTDAIRCNTRNPGR